MSPEYRNDSADNPEDISRMVETLLPEPPLVPDNVLVVYGMRMKAMTLDDYLRHLLVDNPSTTVDPATGEVLKRSASEVPCDWCSGADVTLDPNGTCLVCGYNW